MINSSSISSRLLHVKHSFLQLLFYGSFACWMPFFTVYLHKAGLSGVQIGSVCGVRQVSLILTAPLWGLAADMFGRKRILLLTSICGAIVLPILSLREFFWFIFLVYLFHAALSVSSSSILDSLVLDHVEKDKKISYGTIRVWGGAGWALGAFLSGQFIESRPFHWVFFAGSLVMMLAMLLASRTFLHEGKKPAALQQQASWKHSLQLLKSGPFVWFLAVVAVAGFLINPMFTFHGVFMNEIGATRKLIGFSESAMGFGELPFYLLSAAFVSRLGAKGTVLFGFVFFTVRIFLLSAAPSPRWVIAINTLHGLSFSLFLVGAITFVNQTVPAHWRATGQTLFAAAYFGIGQFMGSMWGGFLYDRVGSRSLFRLHGFLLCLLVVATFLLFRRLSRQAEPEPGFAGLPALNEERL